MFTSQLFSIILVLVKLDIPQFHSDFFWGEGVFVTPATQLGSRTACMRQD